MYCIMFLVCCTSAIVFWRIYGLQKFYCECQVVIVLHKCVNDILLLPYLYESVVSNKMQPLTKKQCFVDKFN